MVYVSAYMKKSIVLYNSNAKFGGWRREKNGNISAANSDERAENALNIKGKKKQKQKQNEENRKREKRQKWDPGSYGQ